MIRNAAPSAPSFLQFEMSFSDIDELATQTRAWNLDFRQLDRGQFRGQILQLMLADVQLARARFHSRLHQTGAPPEGMRTIAIPADEDLELIWRGRHIDGNSLMVFPEGGELCSVSGKDFHVFTCSFTQSKLDSIAENLGLGPSAKLLNSDESIRCDPSRIRRLRSCLRELSGSVPCGHDPSPSEAYVDKLTRTLPAQLLGAIGDAHERSTPVTTHKREAALSKAIDFLEGNLSQPISIDDLAKSAGVSKRTLEYAFAERFGVSPKEYLMILRLRGLRLELRDSSPARAKVSEIASHWGFWHMGQLAADYRKRFGELPSQTLSRVARN